MVKFLANNGMITLHTAAENGQPSVCCDCLKIVIVGMTPFHLAAEACCDCLQITRSNSKTLWTLP